jgi:hypothetical protein
VTYEFGDDEGDAVLSGCKECCVSHCFVLRERERGRRGVLLIQGEEWTY